LASGSRARTPHFDARSGGKHVLLGGAIEAVVGHLDHLGAQLGRSLHPLAVARVKRDPQVADPAGAHLVLQRLPQAGRRELLGAAAVGLEDVDVVGAQRPQGGVELRDDVLGRPVVAAQRPRIPPGLAHPLGVEAMAELRRHHPCVAIARDGATDQRLGEMVAVALRRVDQVDAELARDGRPARRPRPA
jgi:hypothetical protein